MAGLDIGIDLGTTSIIIYIQGKGIVLNEPSVVAINVRTEEVLAVGDEAYRMLGKTPEYIVAERPMRDGVISEYEMTEEMVRRFIKKVCGNLMVKPRIAICIPSSVTGVESNAVVEAALIAGARKVYLIEEPIAAALGAGIDIGKANGVCVVDVGGGTTDIAVISLNGIVRSESIRRAGTHMNSEIIKHFTQKHKILIGDRTAEELKKSIGCVYKPSQSVLGEIKGRHLLTGLPVKKQVTQTEISPALYGVAMEIVEALKEVLRATPPELVGDIHSNGIVLTGGGALLKGFADLISEETGVRAYVADEPEFCVAVGSGLAFDRLEDLNEGFVDATLRGKR